MANTTPLQPGTELRWAIDHVPTPTPTRGTLVTVDVPASLSTVPVELRVDSRKIGEIDWAYEGPVRIAGDLEAAHDEHRVMQWLRRELGVDCNEVRVHAVARGVAQVSAFFRPHDATK